MTVSWWDQTIQQLRLDEGLRLESYQDGGGVWTIGYGHTAGIQAHQSCSVEKAELWLQQDAQSALADLDRNLDWWPSAPSPVKSGLINMCFNLGWPRLSKFTKMLAAGELEYYKTMADEALNSYWAVQVGDRAVRIADLFRSARMRLELGVAANA